MFCNKCGQANLEGETECKHCGAQVTPLQKKSSDPLRPVAPISMATSSVSSEEKTKPTLLTPKFITYTILGVIILIMCFVASQQISASGLEIADIQSVGGSTLEEAYYQELGIAYQGLSLFIKAFGLTAVGTMVHFGLRRG